MEDRDFKGVWIPKELWLNKNLSLVEKALLAEIDSLDNEKHCTASNEYFAEFFGVSEKTISRAIKHLAELKYIESNCFDGRHRVIKMSNLVKMSSQNGQNVQAAVSKCPAINIDNNIVNNNISKDITPKEDKKDSRSFSQSSINFVDTNGSELFTSTPTKPTKKKVAEEIDEMDVPQEIKESLKNWVETIKCKNIHLNFKQVLDRYKKLESFDDNTKKRIIDDATDKIYATFTYSIESMTKYKSYKGFKSFHQNQESIEADISSLIEGEYD